MKYSILVLFVFVFSLLYGQEKTLLYQIKKDGYKSSFIFGTVHIIPDSLYFFPPKLSKTIKKTDLVVLEIGKTGNQVELMKLMQLEQGSCFDIFTAEQKDSVLTWGATTLKITKAQFEGLYAKQKPFVLMQLDVLKMIQGSYKMYETEIQNVASADGLKIAGLETVEFQIGLFDQLPDSVVATMILSQIRHPERTEQQSLELYRAYVNQDIEALFQATQESDSSTLEKLVFQRNENWIPKMETLMQNKSCFFAVGAGHLGGERGVLELLKKVGFEIIPIKL